MNDLAQELNLSSDVIEKTYKAYWLFIRTTIEELPLKEIGEEEFKELRCNFNLPSLGKLGCTLDRFLRLKRRVEYFKKLQNGIKDNKD